jgi:hypothetical protein
LSDSFRVAAARLNIVPACIGDALDAVERILQMARGSIQRELAPIAQLVFVSLHAQQQALAACDLAAEILDVLAATPLDSLDRRRHAISEVGLGGCV